MNHKNQVFSLLEAVGAKLLRQRKHLVYQLPGGRLFVMASTPSDRRAWKNIYAALRALLGLRPEHKAGGRRPKYKQKRATFVAKADLATVSGSGYDFRHKLAHAIENFEALTRVSRVKKIR
jgi:hypothetical protein